MSVLLVAKPGPWGDALANLIFSVAQTHQFLRAETGLLALKLVREATPELVVIASSIADTEVLELVRQIKQITPSVKCLVLAETVQQTEQALVVGADESVPSNISAVRLMATIRQHLRATPAHHPAE